MHYYVRLAPDHDLEFDIGPHGVSLLGRDGGVDEGLDVELDRVPGSDAWVLRVGDRVHRVVARRGEGPGRWDLIVDGVPVRAEALDARTRQLREMTSAMAASAGPRPVVAPMPGLVVKIEVQVGDEVAAGEGVVIVEAMKMENELAVETSGRVVAIPVAAGDAVEKGQVLVELEPLQADEVSS